MSMIVNPSRFSSGGSPPAGISYVGGLTYTFTGTFSSNTTISLAGALSGGSDTSPAAGDFILVTYGIATSNDQSGKVITDGTNNYTSIYTEYVNTGFDACITTSWHIATSGSENVVLPPSGGSNGNFGCVAIIQVFRGVHATTPIDVTTTHASAFSGNPDSPAITPSTAGAWIVAIGVQGSAAGSMTAMTDPSADMTGFISNFINGSGRGCAAGAKYKTDWSSGAFDPGAFGGYSASLSGVVGITLALKPA